MAFPAGLHDFRNGLRYLLQMPACDDIGLIEDVEVNRYLITPLFPQDSRIAAAAAGPMRSMMDPGIDNPARFTPKPCAPGELKASAAGEL